jgi:phospholipid transport system substrate-binding protein
MFKSLSILKLLKVSGIVAGLTAAFLGFSMVAHAQVNQEQMDGARDFIAQLADDALVVLNDEKLTQVERDDAFRDLLRSGFDLIYVSKLVLGRHRRTFNQTQMAEYNNLFPDYVLSIYASRLTEVGDEEFIVSNAIPAGRRDIYVHSKVTRPGNGAPVIADWRVRPQDVGYKIVDLKIEGISQVITQRDEFGSIINKRGIEGLLEKLRKSNNKKS